MLHGLWIEANELHADGRNWAQAPQAVHPGQDVVHAAHEGGGQPALWPAAVFKSGLAITRQSCSAMVAHGSAGIEGSLDLLPSMRQFGCKQHLAAVIIHNGDAGGSRTGVELDA